jgi:hypothetical protein
MRSSLLLLSGILFLAALLQAGAQTNAPENSSTPTNAVADTILAPPSATVPVPPALPSPALNGPGNSAQGEEIDDIRPPYFFLQSWTWLWIALGAIALLGLIALLVLLLVLRRPGLLNPKSAYDLALEKLEKARALLREDNPMPYAVFVSETIRTYLGQRFETPSTRRTTPEFLKLMEGDHTTPLAEHRELLRDFLQSCDMVKFARYQPTLAELEQVQQRAATFITATKPVPVGDGRNGK